MVLHIGNQCLVNSNRNKICSTCFENVLGIKYMEIKCFAYFDEDDI